MLKRSRWIWVGSIGLVLVASLLVWLFFGERYVLAFQTVPDRKVNAYLPVSESDHFQLKFTHSVHLSDVFEEYEIRNEKLYPIQLIYEDTAIGMPSNAGEGETFEMKDGKYYISDLQGEFDSLSLTIGKIRANHTILYHDQSYPLKDYIEAGSFIEIEPEHITNWQWLRGVKMK
ncbi:DUF1850 domain-containing protein [Halobacillus fulvus]|nr:DUF1850 domain-containing protein [Halobacillus fulvus]